MRVLLSIAIGILAVAPSQAGEMNDDEDYPVVEQLHADLPLYTFAWQELWPRSLHASDAIPGCMSRVAFGDWRFEPHPANPYDDSYWYRFRNYGVFHCAALLSVAEERAELVDASEATVSS